MSKKPTQPDSIAIQEARRGLAWALLLSLAILSLVVALFMGFVLLRLLPYAGVLAGSSQPLTLPSGETLHPAWFRLSMAVFAVSLGLFAASTWSLLWLRRAWAKASVVEAKPHPKPAQRNPPKKKRKR
ncbi:hypothetical protein [Meiothermus sp.]|jgi:hypothetical protein|uniref:hypothetical protein n=1 Tax=Meiothermus sp. TaxID=1955249 RepID=UPI0021DBB0F8|nr:hypothetical protein [Meiothermus sp.]GIW25387.1 MAG: hypothetical protein KatS3mg069_1654 [Meiothermus sp.]